MVPGNMESAVQPHTVPHGMGRLARQVWNVMRLLGMFYGMFYGMLRSARQVKLYKGDSFSERAHAACFALVCVTTSSTVI